MDPRTSLLAARARSVFPSWKIWFLYGVAMVFFSLMATLIMAHLRTQEVLLGEVAARHSVAVSALRGQNASLSLTIVLLGIAALVGMTLVAAWIDRSLKGAPAARLASDSKGELAKAESREESSGEVQRRGLSLSEPLRTELRPQGRESAWLQERIELLRRLREQASEIASAHEEIARSARAKDEFIASMSHELRSPLHAVLGLSEALRDEIHGTLSNQQRKFLRSIEESGRNLLGLINDVLDIARIGTQQLHLGLTSVATADLCYSSIAAVSEVADRKSLSLQTRIDPQVEMIQADERRFRQILVSLLSNAVKFTPKGGRVDLEVEGDAADGVVRFTVRDTGIGIAPEEIQRLFRPFVQMDGRRARHYEGTGLGLTLAYHLVDLHRGGMDVESSPGKGSRFTVSVPWRSPSAAALDSDAPSAFQGQPSLLLLAEEKQQIDALTVPLERGGVRVAVAENGRRAMAMVRQELPSMILMKVRLAGAEALDFVEAIRDDPRLRHLPIVALTALAVPWERERCLAAGVDEVQPLPIQGGELLKIVQRHLNRVRRAPFPMAPAV